MKRYVGTILFILLLILVAVGTGYNYFYQPFEGWNTTNTVPSPTPSASPTPTPEPEAFIRSKAIQLIAAPVALDAAGSPSAQFEWSIANNPGFVTLFGSEIATDSAAVVISQLTATEPQEDPLYPYAERADLDPQQIPVVPLVAVDHEGGTVQRLSGAGFTSLPSWQELCEMDQPQRRQVLSTSANELIKTGVNIVFAPVLDLATDNDVLSTRICSGDVETTITAATDFTTIFSSNGILPVFKHFPGIGATDQDLHTATDSAFIPFEQVVAFRRMLDAFPQAGVMTTHVYVENQEASLPCTISIDCINQLGITYPQTLIFTDAIDMESLLAVAGEPDLPLADRVVPMSVESIAAGNDVLVYSKTVTPDILDQVVAALVARYQSDEKFAERLTTSYQKVQALKTSQQETQ